MRIPGSRTIKRIWSQVNRRGIILMYHRIANLNCDPWQLSVSPKNFEEHLQVIKKYSRPVLMREMSARLQYFSLGRKYIAITFDDGYADNFHNAKPILEKHGVPATFYVTSGAVNSREEFWWDEIGRLTMEAGKLPEVFDMTIAGKRYCWRINCKEEPRAMQHEPGTYLEKTELSKSQLHYAIWEIISPLSMEEKKGILTQIAAWAGQPRTARPDYLPMTSQELVSLANSSLFEIGAHTISHTKLSCLSYQKQETEISGSKHALEGMIKRRITNFSYPHGDYSQETLEIVKRVGFDNACTVTAQPVKRGDNPHLLPRLMVLNWEKGQFEEKLQEWLGISLKREEVPSQKRRIAISDSIGHGCSCYHN